MLILRDILFIFSMCYLGEGGETLKQKPSGNNRWNNSCKFIKLKECQTFTEKEMGDFWSISIYVKINFT